MSARQLSEPKSVPANYGFGPVRQADGQVRFRLWAPAAQRVALQVGGDEPMPMTLNAQGLYECLLDVAPGTPYFYWIDGTQRVPDPASRGQDGDVHDASRVPEADYRWRTNDWRGRPWTQTVIYEVHVGLLGGYRGVQERLPDLAELGITAIELMPISDFSGPRNWGYDGVLPYAPDAAYGCVEELKELVDTAHSLGLQVFLDVVYNHFGPDGNYLHGYAPQFFRNDIQTPWGPAIDFRQPQVRAFFAENALYWLQEFRLDGLRLDAVHAISDKSWLIDMARYVRANVGPDRHVHLMLENDDNASHLMQQGYDAQWNDDLHHVLHHMLTGESQSYYADYASHPEDRLARCLAQGFDYQGDVSPYRGGKLRGEPSAALPPWAFIFFLQNHDQTGNRAHGERLTALCETCPQALQAAIALQLLTPQIPLIFMGEEYGATAPFLYFTSFEDEALAAAVRDGRRREFGFAPDQAAGSGIPDPNDEGTWEASRSLPGLQRERDLAWRALYQRLLEVRNRFIVPQLDGAHSLGAQALGPSAIHAAWRMGNGSVLRLYCNLSGKVIALPNSAPEGERIIYPGRKLQSLTARPDSLLPQDTFATLTPRRP